MFYTGFSNDHGGVNWTGTLGWGVWKARLIRRPQVKLESPCSFSSLSPTFNNSPIHVNTLLMEKSKGSPSPLSIYYLKDTCFWNRVFSAHPSSIHPASTSIRLPWAFIASSPPFLQKVPPFSLPTQSFKETPGTVFPKALPPLFLCHLIYGQHFQISVLTFSSLCNLTLYHPEDYTRLPSLPIPHFPACSPDAGLDISFQKCLS